MDTFLLYLLMTGKYRLGFSQHFFLLLGVFYQSKLRAYSGERIPLVGVCKVQVEREDHDFVLDMTVVTAKVLDEVARGHIE